MSCCVVSGVIYYGLLCGEGDNMLLVIVWRVVVICFGLLCGGQCNLFWDIVWRVVVNCYVLLCGEWR